jgi:hypothetical protein
MQHKTKKEILENNLLTLAGKKECIHSIDKNFIPRYKKYAMDEKIKKLYSFVHEIPHTLTYISGLGLQVKSIHLGQRKLFLTQLWFLTTYLKTFDEHAIVVYAGAAPTNTCNLLCNLFPNVKFLLIDPNPFHIYNVRKNKEELKYIGIDNYNNKNKTNKLGNEIIVKINTLNKTTLQKFLTINEQIFVYPDIYIEDFSPLIKNVLGNVFFWSDIRTGYDTTPADDHILWNSAQQYIWLRKLEPKNAMLKFKIPFFYEEKEKYIAAIKNSKNNQMIMDLNNAKQIGLAIIANYKHDKFKFLKGNLLIQCWPGLTSTETRLIVDKKTIIDNKIATYTRDEYDAPLRYHNLISRTFSTFPNAHISAKESFDNCYDCAREVQIMEEYTKKYKILSVEIIRKMCAVVLRTNIHH